MEEEGLHLDMAMGPRGPVIRHWIGPWAKGTRDIRAWIWNQEIGMWEMNGYSSGYPKSGTKIRLFFNILFIYLFSFDRKRLREED